MNVGYTAIFFWACGCFCTLILVKILDTIYVYLVIFLSTPLHHPQILLLK